MEAKRLRNERGWSLADLERLTGIANPHLSSLERGTKQWLPHHLLAIAGAFGCSPRDLLPGEGESTTKFVVEELSPTFRALAAQQATLVRRLAEDIDRQLGRLAEDLERLAGEGGG